MPLAKHCSIATPKTDYSVSSFHTTFLLHSAKYSEEFNGLDHFDASSEGMRAWRGLQKQNKVQYRYLSGSFSHTKSLASVPSNSSLLNELQLPGGEHNTIDPNDLNAPLATAKDLPPSPLTDPTLNAARFGHQKPKQPAKEEELTPFQLRLRRNPFGETLSVKVSFALLKSMLTVAQALATPARQCLFTGIRLPSYFLFRFGIATHPEIGTHWQLPSLAAEIAAREEAAAIKKAKSLGADWSREIQEQPTVGKKPESDSLENLRLPSRTLGGKYFISSYKALDYISVRSSSGSRYLSMFPQRMKAGGVIQPAKTVWREDMADFCLRLMRREIVESIEKLAARTSRIYFVPCLDWVDVSKKPNVAAVLWLGNSRAKGVDGEELEATGGERGGQHPPPYAMATYKGKYVPIYNLEVLLGSDLVEKLKRTLPNVMSESLAVVKGKNLTVNLQMQLWKLTGYVS
ncbi:uncharacterized protein KY384_008292 [Bacidia gigantensis]|uniref:uncharacterized protein n=1 Tax=Bacidia gigantensis TaxID=2732470 RepID=UPI001D046DBC|nr:uncharacterized protein KY384_008292 [Bacidia gigantensis]KAG8526863.1 hypothetical protein KY384_008292 [Bacidia gigantensis]